VTFGALAEESNTNSYHIGAASSTSAIVQRALPLIAAAAVFFLAVNLNNFRIQVGNTVYYPYAAIGFFLPFACLDLFIFGIMVNVIGHSKNAASMSALLSSAATLFLFAGLVILIAVEDAGPRCSVGGCDPFVVMYFMSILWASSAAMAGIVCTVMGTRFRSRMKRRASVARQH